MLWTQRAAPAKGAFHNATTASGSTGLFTAANSPNIWSAWAELAAGGSLPDGAGGVSVTHFGPQVSNVAESALGQIGIDPAGGSSYQPVLTWVIGATGTVIHRGACRYFPLAVQPGASVAVRARRASNVGSTIPVLAHFVSRSGGVISTQYADSFGAVEESSQGTSFTPGNAAWGNYVEMGTTTRPLCWWVISWSVRNPNVTTEYALIELSYGDESTKVPIFRERHYGNTSEFATSLEDLGRTPAAFHPVPVGAKLYIRGNCSNAPDVGYHAMVTAFGGG